MSNLLPGEQKKEVLREYSLRRAAIALIFIASIFMFAILMLVPTRIVLLLRERQVAEELSIKQAAQEPGQNDGSVAILTETKEKLAALSEKRGERVIHRALESIIAERREDISITGVSYSRGSGGPETITLDGVSPTRQRLIAFVRALEGLEGVEKVDLPISDLIKDEELEFSLTIVGTL